MAGSWLLYGASGYTGELIARHAVMLGHRPLLAGRNRASIERLGTELACPVAVFGLDDPATIAAQLGSVPLVLNCAGPFSKTARPFVDACINTHTHYLDITGEIDVIEMAAARDAEARRAEITLMPAVGFDVVPTDCLAAMLADRLPGADRLELAFSFTGGVSRGTAKTILETMPEGGRARIGGRIERVPTGWKSQLVPFHDRARWAMTIPWGDVASAYHTTGIPNIEVYGAAPRAQIRLAKRFGWLAKALKWKPLSALARWQIDRQAPGPNAEARQRERSQLWGRVSHASGRTVSATLETMSGYELTIHTSVAAVSRLLGANAGSVDQPNKIVPVGFQTPARGLGHEFILGFANTSMWWLAEC